MNVSRTREMIEDIKYMSMYEYVIENDEDKLIIDKYFDVDLIDGNKVYLSYTQKLRRKLKLMIIGECENFEIIKK